MTASRREFLKGAGALIVGLSSNFPAFAQEGQFGTHRSHVDPDKLDSWIAVNSDGTVTAFTGKCDLGQGIFTAQTQLIAEELCVPLQTVKLVQCDTDVTPDQGSTSGSQSTPTNFNVQDLALAAATAREVLISMAAQEFGEDASKLRAIDGAVRSASGKQITYARLIGAKKFSMPVNKRAQRRTPKEWTILGKPVPALDRAALMTGAFEFVQNVRVPGMLHGRVVRPRGQSSLVNARTSLTALFGFGVVGTNYTLELLAGGKVKPAIAARFVIRADREVIKYDAPNRGIEGNRQLGLRRKRPRLLDVTDNP